MVAVRTGFPGNMPGYGQPSLNFRAHDSKSTVQFESQLWWCTPITPACGKCWQDQEFKVSLSQDYRRDSLENRTKEMEVKQQEAMVYVCTCVCVCTYVPEI